jgi:hypothetical protein
MFTIYFLLSAASLLVTFGLDLPPIIRLYMYFPIGLTVFGVFGSFTYYLTELFPTRLRATGAGFCYNVGQWSQQRDPLVGTLASRGSLDTTSKHFFDRVYSTDRTLLYALGN